MLRNAEFQRCDPYCLNLGSHIQCLHVDFTSVSHDESIQNVTPETLVFTRSHKIL